MTDQGGDPGDRAASDGPGALPDTLDRALRAAARRLGAAGVASPRRDATLLAAHAAGVDPGEVERLALLGAATPPALDGLVAERERRVPLQHLTGRAGFRRLELAVGPGVFVPRPETEVLVDLALAELASAGGAGRPGPSGRSAPVVVDLCAGSGAIALAVADEAPGASVHAVELDPGAHAWAQRNRDALGLDLDLRCGDAAAAFPELEGEVDVVTCNPPYIPPGAVPVDPEVRDHDPELALYGGADGGLEIPRRMIGRAAALLRAGGLLLLEHANVQGETLVAGLAGDRRWAGARDHLDLTGTPRVLAARRAGG